MRSSGHGGQNVNKTETCVRLIFNPLKIAVTCQEFRTQKENKIKAMRLLREEIALNNTVPPTDEVLKKYGLYFKNNLHINSKNEDLPIIFAIIISKFIEFQADHKTVAKNFNVSPTRLIKFIFENKKFLEKINSLRVEFNKPILRLS